jgi:hypothetical protein
MLGVYFPILLFGVRRIKNFHASQGVTSPNVGGGENTATALL